LRKGKKTKFLSTDHKLPNRAIVAYPNTSSLRFKNCIFCLHPYTTFLGQLHESKLFCIEFSNIQSESLEVGVTRARSRSIIASRSESLEVGVTRGLGNNQSSSPLEECMRG